MMLTIIYLCLTKISQVFFCDYTSNLNGVLLNETLFVHMFINVFFKALD